MNNKRDLDAELGKHHNEAEKILKELFVKIQYPKEAPELVNHSTPEKASVFKDWALELEDKTADLYLHFEKILHLAMECENRSQYKDED